MCDETHLKTAICDLAHHRIDKEWHVVVDDLDDRRRLAIARVGERHGLATNFWCARRPVGHEIVGPLCQRGDVIGAITDDIFRYGPTIELCDERSGDIAPT